MSIKLRDKLCAKVFGGIMGGATTFACKSEACQWAGLVYFNLSHIFTIEYVNIYYSPRDLWSSSHLIEFN